MSLINDSISAYAVVCVLLFAKTTTTAIVQAAMRARVGEIAAPEDARFLRRAPRVEGSLRLKRLSAIWRNDLENLPFFLALAMAYVLLGCWPVGAWVYFMGYVTVRVAHSIAYWHAQQPLRFLCYTAGALICSAMAVHIMVAVVSRVLEYGVTA